VGNLTAKSSISTRALTDKAACRSFAAEIADFVHGSGVYSSELGGVGLAVPGIVAESVGLTPNVNADWPLFIESLQRAFPKVRVRFLNDANAAALGEMWMGAGENAESALLVTLGSGVGSGFVVDGRVVSGGHGAAGEIGHMTVVPGGRPCKCGRAGCVEQYASARGVVQTYREYVASGQYTEGGLGLVPEHDADTLTVFKAARAGDPCARRAFAIMADKLGFALAQVACVIDPAVILLGGGLSSGADVYLDDLKKAFDLYSLQACRGTDIRCASLLGDAGIFGAARYAMDSVERDSRERDWLDPDYGL
jgi:glucokinase